MSEEATSPWRLKRYKLLASTSDLCRTLAEAGEPDGLAVLADRQSAGRGREGRPWYSPAGNLYLSVLLRPGGEAAECGCWALLAGVALAEALLAFLPGRLIPADAGIALKWPNDILLGNAKLGGVLVETAIDRAALLAWLVIGFGANIATAPAVAERATACLADAGVSPVPETVARILLDRLLCWRERYAALGFAPVRAAWLGFGPALGDPASLHCHSGLVRGTFAGLGAEGELLLEVAGRRRVFSVGEVMTGAEG